MNIKVNDFSALTYKLRMSIVQAYLEEYETEKLVNNSFFGIHYERKIKETGKYPVVIKVGYSNYHVKCRKEKKSYVFDIWLTV